MEMRCAVHGCFVLLVILLTINSSEAKTWALLTAGSSGWDNYRHQADICHAYQVLSRNGIPPENIVVMMYNDIANNDGNPTPGVIINKPNGPDVYAGVPHDYTKEDVTPSNFINVLTGNKAAMDGIGSGKVIDSGPDDDVFVYFSDHGAPGILAFPDIAPALTKQKLLKALNLMHTKKKYKKMVLYIEACESGSMFSGKLPDYIKIFATTAANPRESSYAYYFDDERNTYLGDLYSIAWMEDSDKSNLTAESLQTQFLRVKKRTNLSHVQEYGDNSVSKDPVIDYQGEGPEFWSPAKDTREYHTNDGVPSPEVPMAILEHRLKAALAMSQETDGALSQKMKTIDEIQEKIQEILKLRQNVEATIHKIVDQSTTNKEEREWVLTDKSGEVSNLKCHDRVVNAFSQSCYHFGQAEEALRYVYTLANLCELKTIPVDKIVSAIETTCSNKEISNDILP